MIPLFLDVETAPTYKTYAELPQLGKDAFVKKFKRDINNFFLSVNAEQREAEYASLMEDLYEKNASFHAEFSKVICISVGSVIMATPEKPEFIFIKGLVGDEADILGKFTEILLKQKPDTLCAHNGKTFDYPFLCRRMIINGFALPPLLNIGGKKPWEIYLDDTMEMWRFTDLKHYASLITLCYCLGIESPKQDLDGGKVKEAYFAGKIQEIKKYCNLDVYALIQVYRKLKYLAPISTVQYA